MTVAMDDSAKRQIAERLGEARNAIDRALLAVVDDRLDEFAIAKRDLSTAVLGVLLSTASMKADGLA